MIFICPEIVTVQHFRFQEQSEMQRKQLISRSRYEMYTWLLQLNWAIAWKEARRSSLLNRIWTVWRQPIAQSNQTLSDFQSAIQIRIPTSCSVFNSDSDSQAIAWCWNSCDCIFDCGPIIIKDFVKLIADFKNKTDVFTVFGDFSLLFLSLAGRTVNKVAVW